MNKEIEKRNKELLYKAVLALKTEEECEGFFGDICTFKEIDSISQRIMVAKLLKDKKMYSEIVEQTGASTATISRVSRSLLYGNGIYDIVLDRLFGDDKN